MTKIKPVSPKELDKTIEDGLPEKVIATINKLLRENYRGGALVLTQAQIEHAMMHNDVAAKTQEIYDNNWMDFEKAYEKYGWKVEYETPDRDETFKPFYRFTPKRS